MNMKIVAIAMLMGALILGISSQPNISITGKDRCNGYDVYCFDVRHIVNDTSYFDVGNMTDSTGGGDNQTYYLRTF